MLYGWGDACQAELGAALRKAAKGAREGWNDEDGEVDAALRESRNRAIIHFGLIAMALTAGITTVKYGNSLAFRMLEQRLTRPKLIISSSKKNIAEKVAGLFKEAPKPASMVFSPDLSSRLDTIVNATQNINKKINAGKTNVKYRNLMLYGPPGTGKTMFAKELAKQSGLEYAFMSGSSFAKFKEGEGIEALDELFAWANRSKGLMIFVDEAETFLAPYQLLLESNGPPT